MTQVRIGSKNDGASYLMDDELAFQICGQALVHDALAGLGNMPGDTESLKDVLKKDYVPANTRIGDGLAVLAMSKQKAI